MYKKFKIILVPFPFTDLSNYKIRPAIIVSSNVLGSDIIVAFMSSTTKKMSFGDIKIKKTDKNGLKINSIVKISKLATLDKKIILGEIGEVDEILKKKIDQNGLYNYIKYLLKVKLKKF